MPTPVAFPEPEHPPEPEAGPRGLYVYGVIRLEAEEWALDVEGLGTPPAKVEMVRHRALAAVVSEAPSGVPDPTRDNLLAHHHVQEAVMREHTLLPTAFGLVLRNREEVEEVLRTAYATFEGVLAQVEGHVELGLKVHWDRDRVPREVAEEEAQAILDALRPLATGGRVLSLIGERMLLNAAFLVKREREGAFDAKMRALAARHKLLTFHFTGPWAPYHFADIRLRQEPEGAP